MRVKTTYAKTLWCPFARSSNEGDYSANRTYDGDPDAGCKCIADRCMAWRPVGETGASGYCALMVNIQARP
jgi:hypothetical protein